MKDAAALEKAIRAIKIEVSAEEQDALQEELRDFFEWLEPLLAVDTAESGQVLFNHDASNVLHEDEPCRGELAEQQDAAPNFAGGFYLVPRILE